MIFFIDVDLIRCDVIGDCDILFIILFIVVFDSDIRLGDG